MKIGLGWLGGVLAILCSVQACRRQDGQSHSAGKAGGIEEIAKELSKESQAISMVLQAVDAQTGDRIMSPRVTVVQHGDNFLIGPEAMVLGEGTILATWVNNGDVVGTLRIDADGYQSVFVEPTPREISTGIAGSGGWDRDTDGEPRKVRMTRSEQVDGGNGGRG